MDEYRQNLLPQSSDEFTPFPQIPAYQSVHAEPDSRCTFFQHRENHLSWRSTLPFLANLLDTPHVFVLPAVFSLAGLPLGISLYAAAAIVFSLAARWAVESYVRADRLIPRTAQRPSRTMLALYDDDDFPDYPEYPTATKLTRSITNLFGSTTVAIVHMVHATVAMWFAITFAASSLSRLFSVSFKEDTDCVVFSPNVEGGLSPQPVACMRLYYFFAAIFAVVGVVMCVAEFVPNTVVQIVMAVYGLCVKLVMLITAAIHMPDRHTDPVASSAAADSVSHFGYLTFLLPNVLGATSLHHALPNIVNSLDQPHRSVNLIQLAEVGSFILNTAVAVVVSLSFGENTMVNAPMMWAVYNGRETGWGEVTSYNPAQYWWAYLIRFFVATYPVICGLYYFYTNACTFADNMHDVISRDRENTKLKLIIRMVICFGPVILGVFLPLFRGAVVITGGFALLVGVAIPAFFQYRTKVLCDIRSKRESNNEFSLRFLSSRYFAVALAVLLVGFCLGIVTMGLVNHIYYPVHN